MKKIITIIMLVLVCFSWPAKIFANSGPVYWQGYPSSEMLSIKKNSPIVIQNENLVFDFSDSRINSHYTISGKVIATYNMFNPTDRPQSVQMAFPFVSSLDSLLSEDISITAGNEALPFKIYAGNVVNSYGNPWQEDKDANFEFASIVNTITGIPYKAETFKENEKGKLYTINVKPTTDQKINFAVDFNFDSEKTKILTRGFNRYQRNGEKTKIAAWCYETENLEILVLGKDVDLTISAFSDGELKEKTDLFTYQITERDLELKTYLMEYIKKGTTGKKVI